MDSTSACEHIVYGTLLLDGSVCLKPDRTHDRTINGVDRIRAGNIVRILLGLGLILGSDYIVLDC